MADPVAQAAVFAVGHAAAPVVGVPRAAPENAVSTCGSSLRIGLAAAAVIPIPVATPLPHVAAHIVNAQFVGLFFAHRVG